MINEDNNKISVNQGENQQGDTLIGDNLFSSENAVKTLLINLKARAYSDRIERNNWILELIKLKQPISKYELAKISGISYPTIKQICKWLEASDLIKIKYGISEMNGMQVKLVYINEEQKNG